MTSERVATGRPVAVSVAGWVVVIVGGLVAVAVAVLLLPLLSLSDVAAEDRAQAQLLIVSVVAGGIVCAALQVTLGIFVLRGSAIARYVLILFWVIAGVAIQHWAGLGYLIPLLLVAVPVLVLLFSGSSFDWFRDRSQTTLLIPEESVRDFEGPRGVLMLIVNLIVVGLFVAAEVSGLNDASGGIVGIVLGYVFIAYCVLALIFALWALDQDANNVWAGINVVVVVATPIVISSVGFLSNAWPLLGRG